MKTITLFIIFCYSVLVQINIEKVHAQNIKLPNSFDQNPIKNNNNDHNTHNQLPNWQLSKIAVIEENQQVKQKPFIWVFSDRKQKDKQPFLQISPAENELNNNIRTNKIAGKEEVELKDFKELLRSTKKSVGIFTIHRHIKKQKVYLEIKPEQLKKTFLATATLESGVGEKGIYSGIPLNDFLFYFQRIDNRLQFIVRNVKFRTRPGDPQRTSVNRSFSDSVLYSVPIKSINPQNQNIIIDLGDLLVADLGDLTSNLDLKDSPENGYISQAKVFPENLEFQSVLNFINSENRNNQISALEDNRAFTLKVHYSFSQLPNHNYQPRLADERIGYFVTAYQNLSNNLAADPFVRYINRWHLEKKDPTAKISPPKKPIVFWIDNAVPLEYRDAIKEGVLMWNQAFLQAGFVNAIEVRQMPNNATWEPADIRYNTIRWINTVDGFFALGPSRVNPLTGEILDADILFDASFLRDLDSEYSPDILSDHPETQIGIYELIKNYLTSNLTSNSTSGQDHKNLDKSRKIFSHLQGDRLCYVTASNNKFFLGKLAISLLTNSWHNDQYHQNFIHDYLRLIIAHEVGHTLGLRHNFRGSNYLSPEELNNPEITNSKGLTTSIMDYIPPNIARYGTKQGDYFPKMVGPYDQWAIEYGYTPSNAHTTMGEKPFLNAIAARSNQQELSYATDEDVTNNDPTVSPWDHSNNVLVYAETQLANSQIMWSKLERYSQNLQSYNDVSAKFMRILINYSDNLSYTAKYIGGQSFYRLKPGDNQGQLPFVIVPIAEQRQALNNLQKYAFGEDAFNFSPQLLNKLTPSRWRHWGSKIPQGRLDYPIHDLVLDVQTMVLNDLLAGDRLRILKDLELKNPPGQTLTLSELFNTLLTGIWTEVLQPQAKVRISSLRRGLQRKHLEILGAMVLRKKPIPEDARTLAWYQLRKLNKQLKRVSSDDQYTQAFLLETSDRIDKILSSSLVGN